MASCTAELLQAGSGNTQKKAAQNPKPEGADHQSHYIPPDNCSTHLRNVRRRLASGQEETSSSSSSSPSTTSSSTTSSILFRSITAAATTWSLLAHWLASPGRSNEAAGSQTFEGLTPLAVTVARLNSRGLERRAGSKAEEAAWKLLPRGPVSSRTRSRPAKAPAGLAWPRCQGGMTESLEMPRFGWLFRLLPLFLGSVPSPPPRLSFSAERARDFVRGPKAAGKARAGGQLASHQLLQYSELHGWGWRRNGKRQCASGGAPPRCVAGLEKLRGSKRATMAVAVDSP
jgi:hypothetical protein